MRRVHLDHNATTPIRPEVRALFLETLDTLDGNASSVHASGRRARQVLDTARERVAGVLGVGEEEIVFTSGGTESNNLALLGAARAAGPASAGVRVVTTAVEHSSVLGPAARLEREGYPVDRIGVDPEGRPDLDRLLARARGAAVVSVMAANNEVGTVPDLARVGSGLAELEPAERPVFHTDAVQALGRVPLALRDWGIGLVTLSAHKVGGPLGVGLLVRRPGVALEGVFYGGGQEAELRPGTENVPGVAAAALAVELAVLEQTEFAERTRALSRELWHGVRVAFPDARLLGPPIDADDRLPNTLDVWLPAVDGHVLVTRLDLEGLEASAGSACASGSLEPSHVLLAMGLSANEARAGLRLSLGRTTVPTDIHSAVDILSKTFLDARKS